MTHIFIVNENTFDYHLQYLFAGTGYGNNEPNLNETCGIDYNAEKTLTAMISDISKVRINDYVIFYVTGCKKFFGIFQIASLPFLNPLSENFLGEENHLNKYLPFRVKIKPYKVYPVGISEHSALDEIAHLNHPYEMCWSLIYRKLAGNRGCSFITEFEYQKLQFLIEKANNDYLKSDFFCYDKENQCIKSTDTACEYTGSTDLTLNIKNRLLHKTGAYEVHLQAYITQNFDNLLAKYLLPESSKTLWIGNEVICSVGEQRIDVLIVSDTECATIIRIIELKDERPTAYAIEQLKWYITWVDQYISPNFADERKPIRIIPTIIAEKFNRNTKNKKQFANAFSEFNNHKIELKNSTLDDMEYIIFEFENDDIEFKKETVI